MNQSILDNTMTDSEHAKLRELPGLRILVAEDHPEVARLFSILLREHGCHVMVCPTGIAAAESAPTFRPDVALLDIRLPGLDGYQVAERIRDELQDERPLIIAVTAYSQDRYRDQAMEAGIDLYLTKPVSGKELLQHIEETPRRNLD